MLYYRHREGGQSNGLDKNKNPGKVFRSQVEFRLNKKHGGVTLNIDL